MFRQLHPQQTGFNLSLVNIACTNMAETAADTKESDGRDIGRMFKKQDTVLKDFRVTDQIETAQANVEEVADTNALHQSSHLPDADASMDAWDEDEDEHWPSSENTPDPDSTESTYECQVCQASIPNFAFVAHLRFHEST